MKANVLTLANKAAGEIELNDDVFGLPARADLLQRAVRYQLSKRQAGTHKTKDISEVSGTGKKPFKQKGTGNARQGSLRSPQFRGGAVIFGPVVRSHAHDLPKKVRKLALRTALSAKQAEGKLTIVDTLKMKVARAKDATEVLGSLNVSTALFIDDTVDTNFALSIRNLRGIDVLPQIGANVYDILNHDNLVLTKAAVEKLEERLA